MKLAEHVCARIAYLLINIARVVPTASDNFQIQPPHIVIPTAIYTCAIEKLVRSCNLGLGRVAVNKHYYNSSLSSGLRVACDIPFDAHKSYILVFAHKIFQKFLGCLICLLFDFYHSLSYMLMLS